MHDQTTGEFAAGPLNGEGFADFFPISCGLATAVIGAEARAFTEVAFSVPARFGANLRAIKRLNDVYSTISRNAAANERPEPSHGNFPMGLAGFCAPGAFGIDPSARLKPGAIVDRIWETHK